jgi:hypothetical protein
MANIVYSSIRGTPINLDEIKAKYERTIAVGNASMNTRGDVVDSMGNIITPVEETIRNYNMTSVKPIQRVSLREMPDEYFMTPEQVKATVEKTQAEELEKPDGKLVIKKK